MGRKRRANGEGSVRRRADGRWEVRFMPASGGKSRSAYARTQREAVQKLQSLKAEDGSGVLPVTGKESFGEWVDHWLENVHRRKVRESTFGKDSSLIRKHIVARLGGYSLAKLQPADLDKFISQMKRDGVGARTVAHCWVHVRQILRNAVRSRRIPYSPAEAVEPPRSPRKEAKHLDAGQARALLTAAEGSPFEAFIMLAVNTGARFGELAALVWRDIDLDRGRLTITKSLAEIYDATAPVGQRNTVKITEPKTDASSRTIVLGRRCLDVLRAYRDNADATPHPTARVFGYEDGSPLRAGTFRSRVWKPLLKRAGLPESTQFKVATRHTAATLALVEGVSARVIQERLGHSSVTTTLQVYSHVTPELKEHAADAIEAAIFDPKFDPNQDAL